MLSVTGSVPRSAMVLPQKQHWKSVCLEELAMRGKLLPSNGSRLSCGASPGGRKRLALRDELVGLQTHASFEGRPRQLQALVRRQRLGQSHGHVLGQRKRNGRVQDSAQTGSVTGELLSAAPLKGNVERHGISAPLGDGFATEAAREIS